ISKIKREHNRDQSSGCTGPSCSVTRLLPKNSRPKPTVEPRAYTIPLYFHLLSAHHCFIEAPEMGSNTNPRKVIAQVVTKRLVGRTSQRVTLIQERPIKTTIPAASAPPAGSNSETKRRYGCNGHVAVARLLSTAERKMPASTREIAIPCRGESIS